MVRSVPACGVLLVGLCSQSWAQSTSRVSLSSSAEQGRGDSVSPSISADGRYVAFQSIAFALTPGDTNGAWDVFVHDRLIGATRRVSVASSGAEAHGSSFAPAISSDGRFVAYYSLAADLVPGDTNDATDVFVRDLSTGVTARISVSSSGAQASGGSDWPAISADGRYVAFESTADDLVPGDTNGWRDVFVRDTVAGTTTRVSVDSNGGEADLPCLVPAISGDGRFVAFSSYADNLVPGDTNQGEDVFVHDMLTGPTTRVSVGRLGEQGNGQSMSPAISADGRHVAFTSTSSNLVLGDTNAVPDVFVHDRLTGITRRASVGLAGGQVDSTSYLPTISADGRFVAFQSYATDLVPSDQNGVYDVFVHDMLTGANVRASVDSAGVEGNGGSGLGGISGLSADGRFVAFASLATNLVASDVNGSADVFVHDSGALSAFAPLCFGDGTAGACPCGNAGGGGHGCENSASTGGALLSGSGLASLSSDGVQLSTSGELASAMSVVLQGSSFVEPATFGDGLRCAGGALLRLFTKAASGGALIVPDAGDPSISARSAALGDTIPLGATRIYQVYYRDPNLGFCPGGFNATHAVAIAWGA